MASTHPAMNVADQRNDVSPNMHKPASEHEPRLQLLNIAQELQDMIYEYAFSRHVRIDQDCVDADWDGSALLLALYTNSSQDIFRRAEEISHKCTLFHIKQEHLLPWLRKHKTHAKYIKRIMVTPTEEIKEEDETPWSATSCMALPGDIADPAEKVLWLAKRTLVDTQCALDLQSSTVDKMYEDVEGAGITLQRKIFQVPVKFGVKDDTITLWCERPLKEVAQYWRQRMENIMNDLIKAVEVEEDGEGVDADADVPGSE